MATRSLSYHLGLLVLLATVPLIALAAGLLLWSTLVSRHAVERRLTEAARLLGIAVEREAATWAASLQALAAAPLSACRPSLEVQAQAAVVAGRYGGWIAYEEDSGADKPDALRPAFNAARPIVSDAFSAPNGARAVLLAVPAYSEGRLPCWISLGVRLERFPSLVKPVRGRSWTGVLMDGNHGVLATSRDAADLDLGRAPHWYVEAARGRARGLVEGADWPQPGATRVAFERINDGRWTVAVAAPRDEMVAAWFAPLALGIGGALLTMALSISSSALCARRLRRQVNALVDLAAGIGGDAPARAPPRSSMRELARLGQALAQADEAVRQRRVEHELHMASEVRRAAAESADRSKDLFLATLSHELRGALTAIIGWLDVARSSMDERHALTKALDIALRNAQQQARMIDDLLDVSRIVSGKFTVQRHPVELARLVRETLEAWRPAAEEARIELRSRLHEPVFVEGDRQRLLQVLSNLLGNGIKFNRPGGWVEVALEQRGREVRLSVADNGEGITQHALAHIFERFWQAEPVGRRPRPGLGLGLPLVHYMVEKHGGSIDAESAGPGRGARFTVRLPGIIGRPPVAVLGAPQAAGEAEPSLQGLGVVALDEDRDTLGWLQHLFAAHGATTWVAHTPEEAMRLVARVEPDVLISDMAISGLIKTLHEQHPRKRIATLAFSAEPTDAERERAFAAGYDGFVAKTSEPGVLLRAVRSLVKESPAPP